MSELQKHAVAYINSDSNGRGFFYASGSHDLEKFINDVARDVQDPEKNMSVLKRAQLRRIALATNAEEREEVRNRANLRIGSLGDGSDYAPFLDHAGISALNIGFGGESDADQYHSIYDDFYWYTHFEGYGFLIRTRAFADGWHGGHEAGRFRFNSIRLCRSFRHGLEIY